MPSEQVTQVLEELKNNLSELKPAIKHVEAAQRVTEMVSKIPERHVNLIEQLKEEEVRFKTELKGLYQIELNQLADDTRKIQQTAADLQGFIKEEQLVILKQIKDHDIDHKTSIESLFAAELTDLSRENKSLQKTTADIQNAILLEQENLSLALSSVQSFHSRVEKIQFPERLDKLDANVAGNIAAAQAIQSRLDNLERNISDRLKDVADYQKETRQTVLEKIETTNSSLKKVFEGVVKKQQILTFITWTLIATAIIVICFIK